MSMIYLNNVRLSFPVITEARVSKKFPNNPPQYSADFILTPDNPCIAEFMKVVGALVQAAWKENTPAVMNMITADRRSRCYGQGHEKTSETTLKIHPGYEGNLWIGAKSNSRPQIIRLDGKAAVTDMEALDLARKMYGGCYVNAVVRPWIRLANRGVSCDLVAIQFAKDGEPFGDAQPDASNFFGAVAAAPAAAATPAGMAFPSFMQ